MSGSGDIVRQPRHAVGVVGAVKRKDGRYLAIRRTDNGNWQLPGGLLLVHESLEQGVEREVLEETGVHVQVDGLAGVYKDTVHPIVSLVFRCSVVSGKGHPTKEARQIDWITPTEADMLMNPSFAIQVADSESDGATTRAHAGDTVIGPPC